MVAPERIPLEMTTDCLALQTYWKLVRKKEYALSSGSATTKRTARLQILSTAISVLGICIAIGPRMTADVRLHLASSAFARLRTPESKACWNSD